MEDQGEISWLNILLSKLSKNRVLREYEIKTNKDIRREINKRIRLMKHLSIIEKIKLKGKIKTHTQCNWLEFISKKKFPYTFTMAFKSDLSQGFAIKYLSKFLHFLNTRVIGKHYKNRSPLTGFVFREYTKEGRIHFHVLVEDNESIDDPNKKYSFTGAIIKCRRQMKSISTQGNIKGKLFGKAGVKVDAAVTTSKLVGYFLKSMRYSTDADFIWTFYGDNIDAIDEKNNYPKGRLNEKIHRQNEVYIVDKQNYCRSRM